MSIRAIAYSSMFVALLGSSGCCCLHSFMACGPECNDCGGFTTGLHHGGCYEGCGCGGGHVAHESGWHGGGGGCDSGCDTSCDSGCGHCGLGLLDWLGLHFCGCGDWGCGATYWGDFHGGGCNTCDCHGNWTGPSHAEYGYSPSAEYESESESEYEYEVTPDQRTEAPTAPSETVEPEPLEPIPSAGSTAPETTLLLAPPRQMTTQRASTSKPIVPSQTWRPRRTK